MKILISLFKPRFVGALLLLFASLAAAQNAARFDLPILPTTPANTPIGSLPTVLAVTNAMIAVCGYPATMSGGMCTNTITTYTDSTLATACPSTAQLTPQGSSSCVSTTGLQGGFGFWYNASTQTHITYTMKTSWGMFGPFDIAQPVGATSTPGGTNLQLQFNNAGTAFGGSQITTDSATHSNLTVPGTTNSTGLVTGTAGFTATNSKYQNREDMRSLYSDLGCDPTGVTDCLPSIVTDRTTYPNARYFAGVPTGSASANYLLGASASNTIAAGISLALQNGATISTGHNAASTISSIQRTTYGSGTTTYNLTGCSSSATLTNTTETFSGCTNPNNFIVGELVILTGLTNVPNCYGTGGGATGGCSISTTGLTANGFTVINPAVTANVASAAETGSAIYQASEQQTWLAATGIAATSSETANSITINFPSNNNPIPALPIVLTLTNTTNVRAGNYVVEPSTVTSGGFTVLCPAGCTTKTTTTETGEITWDQTGYTMVHFATALAGAPTPGLGSANSTGLGYLICSGTTNFNGPYIIQGTPDSQDLVLLDPRQGVATETAGSCYVPYVLTLNSAIEASPQQRVVQDGSAIRISGANRDCYVGWYGAQGSSLSTNDWLPFEEDLFWCGGREILAPKLGAPTFGSQTANSVDYKIGDSLMLVANQTHFAGTSGGIWGAGMTQLAWPSGFTGDGIITLPNAIGSYIHDLEWAGPSQFVGSNLSTYTAQNYLGVQGNGFLNGALDIKFERVSAINWPRNGIRLSSDGLSFYTTLYGLESSDYWQINGFLGGNNHGYGVDCENSDCNGGLMHGTNDMKNNSYGGLWCNGQTGCLANVVNGEGNTQSLVTAGPTDNIITDTVSGSGYNAVCTLVAASAFSANVVNGGWITVAGTTGSASAAGMDGTFNITSLNTGTKTLTYFCPGATGGPAVTGTAQNSSSAQVYAVFATLPIGIFSQKWTPTGAFGGNIISVNPYWESTNGCPFLPANGSVYGGDMETTIQNCFSSVTQGTELFPGSSGLDIYGNGLTLHSPVVANPIAETLINGPSGTPHGSSFAGSTSLKFCVGASTVCDWTVQEGIGGNFILTDLISGDNSNVLFASTGGGLYLSSPGTTGVVNIQRNTSNVQTSSGSVNFFGNANLTTIATTGISTPSLSCTGTPCGSAAPVPNSRTNGYTVLTGDRGNLNYFTGSTAGGWTLPQAGTTGFTNNFSFYVRNSGAAVLTLTPTTSTINGASFQQIFPGAGGIIFSDNTNYFYLAVPGSIPTTTGTSVTLTGPSATFICTSTCTVTPPSPVAGYQFCVRNDTNVSTVITLAALGSSARYENTAETGFGTAGTGTYTSGGAVGAKLCLQGRDTTTYLVMSFSGTWTAH